MQIGQYITSNGGVVTAEELAPYLDVENTEKMVLLNLTCTQRSKLLASFGSYILATVSGFLFSYL